MRRLAAVTVVILAIVVVYPLSMGPACVICNRSESGDFDEFFSLIYAPLAQLPEPLLNALERWEILCESIWQSLADE